MTYNKPKISYTDMCIWIDSNAYSDSCDELLLYEYLYHIMNMLAHDKSYFSKTADYDDFSIYSASRLFMRLRDTTKRYSNPIKSILNYAKKVSYPYKVEFEKLNYSENPTECPICTADSFDLGSYICDQGDIFNHIDFNLSLSSIDQTIKVFLRKIPFSKNSAEWYNIYLSCLLTFLDRISFNDNLDLGHLDINKLNKTYRKANSRDPILYHLPDNMYNYVNVLVKQIQHVISEELSFETNSNISADVSMKNLILATSEDK